VSRAIAKILAPLQRRIKLIVSRAIVKLIYPDEQVQELQVVALQNEVLDKIEHIEPYGLTAHPLKESEAVLLSVGGRRSHTIVINVGDRRYRLTTLTEGQVALYDANGSTIIMNNDGTITITASGGVNVVGDLNVDGAITATGDVSDSTRSMQDIVDGHNAHVHTGNAGNPTSPPTTPMT